MIIGVARRAACCLCVLAAALIASAATEPAFASDAAIARATSNEAPAVALWTQRREYAGVVYFLNDIPAEVSRYDTVQGTWLAPIEIGQSATAFAVDESGIYLSESQGVAHFALDGTPLGVLPGVPGAQAFIELGATFVLTGIDQSLGTYDKSTGAAIDSFMPFGPLGGYSATMSDGHLFAFAYGDILGITFNPQSGQFIGQSENSLINMPIAGIAYARPEGGIVVDAGGTAYSAADLHYVGSLGGAIQSIAYLPDSFVVMQGVRLARYSYAFHLLGEAVPPPALADIVASNGELYSIATSGSSLMLAPMQLGAFHAPAPTAARAWSDTAGHADAILGDAGTLLLTSNVEHAVYPFDAETWTFAEPIPLLLAPLLTAYSPVNREVYATYDGGAIYGFPIDERGSARHIANTIVAPGGLADAGGFVFAEDGSGAWASHYTFTPDGTLLSRFDWNYYSRQYEWDPVRRKMYFFRDDTSPDDLQWEEIGVDGTIVGAGETPYHGEVLARTPIRVAPDGSRIVIGSGQVFDASTLLFAGDLGHWVNDVAWSSTGDLYGVGSDDVGADEPVQFMRFTPSYQLVSAAPIRGTPRRLLRYGANFLYVADVGGTTIVGVLDPYLAKADLAVDPVALGVLFGGGSTLTFDITVGNNGSVTSHGAIVSGDLSGLANPTWICFADTEGVTGCDNSPSNSPVISAVLDLPAGGQVRYEITGTVPADAINMVAIPFGIEPADPSSDPELRNNSVNVRVHTDELFRGTFETD